MRPRRPDDAIQRTASRLPRKGVALSCHRVQRVTSLVEARPHSRCPDGVESAARYVVPSAHPRRGSCGGQGRTGKQLVANRLHSQRNRAERVAGSRQDAVASVLGLGLSPRRELVRDLLNLARDLGKFERIAGLHRRERRSLAPPPVKQLPSRGHSITVVGFRILGDLQQDVGKT